MSFVDKLRVRMLYYAIRKLKEKRAWHVKRIMSIDETIRQSEEIKAQYIATLVHEARQK